MPRASRGVVDHQDLVGILGVKHGVPAGDGLVHHGAVVDDAQGAPGVGDRIEILRVIGQVLEPVGDFGKVGNLVVVQRLEHVLLDELGDHIVRGDDHIVAGAAQSERGVELLVAGRGLVVDFDPGRLLKLLDEALINIFTPAAHVDHPLFGTGAGAASQQAGGQGQGKNEGKCFFNGSFLQYSMVFYFHG